MPITREEWVESGRGADEYTERKANWLMWSVLLPKEPTEEELVLLELRKKAIAALSKSVNELSPSELISILNISSRIPHEAPNKANGGANK